MCVDGERGVRRGAPRVMAVVMSIDWGWWGGRERSRERGERGEGGGPRRGCEECLEGLGCW